jgi:hypothetical protein
MFALPILVTRKRAENTSNGMTKAESGTGWATEYTLLMENGGMLGVKNSALRNFIANKNYIRLSRRVPLLLKPRTTAKCVYSAKGPEKGNLSSEMHCQKLGKYGLRASGAIAAIVQESTGQKAERSL